MNFLIFLLTFTFNLSCYALITAPEVRKIQKYFLRMEPGEDPRLVLETFAKDKNILAASITSAVGSFSQSALRFADQNSSVILTGKKEVVSLTGTISANGPHIHVSLADDKGQMIGGHLALGSTVYTTLEVVLEAYPEVIFERKKDIRTGHDELFFRKK